MPNQHNWINIDEDDRRCIYCNIRWHPSRDNKECQANFPPPENDKN